MRTLPSYRRRHPAEDKIIYKKPSKKKKRLKKAPRTSFDMRAKKYSPRAGDIETWRNTSGSFTKEWLNKRSYKVVRAK